jgi:hypothetical protein
MTYRERRLAKAERLRGWADKRQAEATRTLNSQPELRHDWAFITEPGRIPERDRMNRADERAFRSLDVAESMARRADGIDAQADHAIYSDDPDAGDRLRERITELEAKRDRMKAANAEYRKAHRAELAALTLYGRDQALPHASWELTNLSGNLGRLRKRLEGLEHPRPTWFHASRRDPDVCYRCGRPSADHTPHENVPSILMCPARTER